MLEANRAKDYPAAQRAAESAYRLRPDPNLLYNLGRFHQKQGHKAEAIDHYERFLASGDSSLTPELRQTIEGYLAELRRPQVSLPPPVLANAPTEEARLGWRFYTGVPLGVVGLGLIGVGAAVLAVDGKCTTNELPCPFRYNGNLGTGLGMLVPGVAVLGVGVTLSIMDVARRRKATLVSSR